MGNISKPIAWTAALGTWVIMMVSFGSAAVTPALASLFEAFSDSPQWAVSLISTLPSLTTMVGCLLFGAVVTSGKIKFKPVAIVGMLIYGIFGILPCWFNQSLAAVLVLRALCGFGIGLIMPISSAWFLRAIRDRVQRSRYLSWNQTFGSGGSSILTLLGGFLCAIDWRYTFLAYLFVFVGFVLMLLFFREPPSVGEILAAEGDQATGEFAQTKRVGLTAKAWFVVVLCFLFQMLRSPGLMMLSVNMELQGAGGADLAGSLLTVFVVVTAVACLFGDRYVKAFGKFTTCAFYLFTAIGMGFLAFGTQTWMFVAGMVFIGLGNTLVFLLNFEIGIVTSPAGLAWASSLIMLATNLGNFLSSFWLGFLQGMTDAASQSTFPVVVGMVMLAICGVVFAVANCLDKRGWGK